MEQRDYMMRQIEQLGQVLARMLARLLNIKQVPDAGLSLDEIKQVYSDELDLSLDLVLGTPADRLIEILRHDLKFIDQHLEKMVEILSETADILDKTTDNEASRELRIKSIIILEHLQDSSGNYSMERITRITELKKLI